MAEKPKSIATIWDLKDADLSRLIDNRWESSATIWDEVTRIYDENIRIYENRPEWLEEIPRKKSKVRNNRIFVNTESVINGLLSSLAKPNAIPTRETDESRELSSTIEDFLNVKCEERNVKEQEKRALRNLYFSRLLVLKVFWNTAIDDFDCRAIDPRKIRIGKTATNEAESEFAIEEVTDNVRSLIRKFPEKREHILKKAGVSNDASLLIENPEVTYKEAWIGDMLAIQYKDLIIKKVKNPYWDWDGLIVTQEEAMQLGELVGEPRRNLLSQIRENQETRKFAKENGIGEQELAAYYFNHFDRPRKPYIVASWFNNEQRPIGRTGLIEQAKPLQESVDRRKRQIDDNAELMNGILKVNSDVMGKADAQRLRFEPTGLIWGKNAVGGVEREAGQALPNFIFDDLQDSRNEIDNIMAASSAFRGEREGAETKAGRLALIEQSYLRLNELVAIMNSVNYELFNWFYQLMKVRYTEHHYAKMIGPDGAVRTLELMQDDFEDGMDLRIISGKAIPEDAQFKFEMANKDVQAGYISPLDYLEIAGYEDPKRLAQNALMYQMNPAAAVGVTPEQIGQLQSSPTGVNEVDQGNQQRGQALDRAQQVIQSDEFNNLPPEQKKQTIARLKALINQ